MLEDWVRINQLDSGNILEGLKCIIQATQLLQVSKSSLDDVDAICEVCNSLNTLQVQYIELTQVLIMPISRHVKSI